MLGNILEINDNSVVVELAIDINEQPNLVNLHVVFEDGTKRVVGEIVNINQTVLVANIVGEFVGNNFVPGSSIKPSFRSKVRMIKTDELQYILGKQESSLGYTLFGTSNIYENYRINVSINEFFSNHFSVLGNSGSGKSCTVASIVQKLFTSKNAPVKSNVIFFDAFGEYTKAFSKLHDINKEINYKVYTTSAREGEYNLLRIPVWLLDVDDLALLLDVNTPTQLPIIEKTLKLVPILTGSNADVVRKKNDIISRALLDILLSGGESTKIRDQVVAILTKFNTNELNLESQIAQPGYIRTLKQCLYIDKTGKMQEMELVVEFIRTFISDVEEEVNPSSLNKFYTLSDLEMAMDFALISEGILKSEKVFDYANVVSVRLHTLASGEYKDYFDYPEYITKNDYIKKLTTVESTGAKAQLINFNISYVDDRIAKVFTKIISRMLFTKAVSNERRGSEAYHIIVEEAHRYIQKDIDIEILGYNIFERITKEGRKYGVFLGIITQRPSELSDTTISQCSNFIILRTLHPKDLDYIRNMVPNISSEIVAQLKNLKPGNCIAFGSAFKVPISMYIDLPNPRPLSNNVDLETVWYQVEEKTKGIVSSSGGLKEIVNQAPTPSISKPVSSFPEVSVQPIGQSVRPAQVPINNITNN
ncbi:MAG: ATP-binding protein [Firmicutes bacterium]|nr:ATP-binding protein [Bacillota bacterium]